MRVLFLCSENSCRSQMAEGFLRAVAGDRFEVASAGTIGTKVNPRAVTVMAESGIDISGHRSKPVDEFTGQIFDFVVTVCGTTGDKSCPVFGGQANSKLHWPFEDPAHATGNETEILETFRRVRDQVEAEIKRFTEKN
ncbi:MAG: arsenate reductase ArsC [candidate division Zixibacteria bacterium]|nr:arsenate reductase ArsC [candidate division Zixibacteria bacterium]